MRCFAFAPTQITASKKYKSPCDHHHNLSGKALGDGVFFLCVFPWMNERVCRLRTLQVRTAGTFSFRYGRIEVKAKLPKGDWYGLCDAKRWRPSGFDESGLALLLSSPPSFFCCCGGGDKFGASGSDAFVLCCCCSWSYSCSHWLLLWLVSFSPSFSRCPFFGCST